MRRGGRSIIWMAAGLGLTALGPACVRSGDTDARRPVDTLTLGAYSVVREAFHDGILPAFAARWEQETGRAVRFEESYNGSGAQARAIASGFDADVAVLSLEGDMDLLVKAGMVRPDPAGKPTWRMVTRSLVVIGHREGNPKAIRDWSDLTRPGVGVLYPDPKTSGGARWNIAAIWGAGLLGGPGRAPDPDAARDLLAGVQANVVNMDGSGRQSLATFERGTGDAVVTYENELLLRRKFGARPIPYATPDATLQIESPAALVGPSIDRHGNRAVAEAFFGFLLSAEGQAILADYGFRPVDPGVRGAGNSPRPSRLFTIRDLGGWPAVKKTVFDDGGVWASTFTRRAGGR